MAAQQTKLKVVVRVRPYNRLELERNQRSVIDVIDATTLVFDPIEEVNQFFFQGVKQPYRDMTKRANKKLTMEFDRVFDINNNNVNILEECTAPMVDAVLNGYNCSVFVYGATGAGKTFTMHGGNDCLGLTFLTMRDLFDKMQEQRGHREFDVGVSYLEVYNEQVMNLLTKKGPLKLLEDSRGVVVSGLSLETISCAEDLLDLLSLGNSNRTQHPTDSNAESSRSHAIFQVHIRMTDRTTGTKRIVKFSMIDLAGSERSSSTKGMGQRFKEGASINKSLLTLGNCINKLADGEAHIPYRDSNLTRILKDSLGGNCLTLMVANVSMSSLTYEDTYNTLKYASRAKNIRTNVMQNPMESNLPKAFYIKKVNELMAENDRIKSTNKALEAKLQLPKKAETAVQSIDQNDLKIWYRKMDATYGSVIRTQGFVHRIKSNIKQLKIQANLVEKSEAYKPILALSQQSTLEGLVHYTKTMRNITKLIEDNTEELRCWTIKLMEDFNNLDQLITEVKASKYADALLVYKESKDFQMKNAKQIIEISHMFNIGSKMHTNTNRVHQTLRGACEVLQKFYECLDKENQLTPDLRIIFEQFQNLIKTNHMGDNENAELLQQVRMQTAGKREHVDNEKHTSSPKRQRINHDVVSDVSVGGCTAADVIVPIKEISNFNNTMLLRSSTQGDPKLFQKQTPNPSNTTMVLRSTTEGGKQTPSTTTMVLRPSTGNKVRSLLTATATLASSGLPKPKVLFKSKTIKQPGLSKTIAGGVKKKTIGKIQPQRRSIRRWQ